MVGCAIFREEDVGEVIRTTCEEERPVCRLEGRERETFQCTEIRQKTASGQGTGPSVVGVLQTYGMA